MEGKNAWEKLAAAPFSCATSPGTGGPQAAQHAANGLCCLILNPILANMSLQPGREGSRLGSLSELFQKHVQEHSV